MDSLSYSRGLSENPVSAFKEIMAVLSLKESSQFNPQRSVLLLMLQQPHSVAPEEG